MRIELKLGEDMRTFDCSPGERLLHAGLRSGVDLPYECATGTCGSCSAKLVEGEVDELWPEAPGRKYLVARDEFLLCQCAPRADCRAHVRPHNRVPMPAARPVAGQGVVCDVHHLARDVVAFTVATDQAIDFEAGQFVCLQFRHEPGFRSYSMVNYQRGTRRLDFVVKRKPGGRLTPWLLDGSIEGHDVEWFGPVGRAIFQPGLNDLPCIAGGTGIAGMMSILRCASQSGHFMRSKGHVFFGVRSWRDAFYLHELDELAAASEGKLEVTVALSEEEPRGDAATRHRHLLFRKGLVHEVAKAAMAGRCEGVVAFLAGPPPAVDASMRVLLAARVPAKNIRFDKFS
jgi:toluene monooxygenase electron transfer component